MQNTFSENQIIVIWAIITSFLMELLNILGNLYRYQGFFTAIDFLNSVGSTFEAFLAPYSIGFPPCLFVTIPILIIFGLLIRYFFRQKNHFSSQAKFLVLTLIILAWGELNKFALDILASA